LTVKIHYRNYILEHLFAEFLDNLRLLDFCIEVARLFERPSYIKLCAAV